MQKGSWFKLKAYHQQLSERLVGLGIWKKRKLICWSVLIWLSSSADLKRIQ